MKYDFDRAVERRGSHCSKWDGMRRYVDAVAEDTIPMWVADMDFRSPEPVIEAIVRRAGHGVFGYSLSRNPDYVSAFRAWMSGRFGLELEADEIFSAGSLMAGIDLCIEYFTDPGDGILIQTPVYQEFAQHIRKNGRTLVVNPLREQNGCYTMDFDLLERQAADPANKMLLLCSPHNPVGRVWSESELRRLLDICTRNGVVIVSDEIHCDITRRGIRHIPLLKLAPEADVVLCAAPAKTFNIVGLSGAFVAIRSPRLLQIWNERYVSSSLSPLAMAAAQAAYRECEPWLEALTDYLDANIDHAIGRLRAALPKLRVERPEGTYLLWIDFRAYAAAPEALLDRFVREARVLPVGGTVYGEEGAGFARLNIACPRELLDEALKRIIDAFRAR